MLHIWVRICKYYCNECGQKSTTHISFFLLRYYFLLLNKISFFLSTHCALFHRFINLYTVRNLLIRIWLKKLSYLKKIASFLQLILYYFPRTYLLCLPFTCNTKYITNYWPLISLLNQVVFVWIVLWYFGFSSVWKGSWIFSSFFFSSNSEIFISFINFFENVWEPFLHLFDVLT